MMEELEPRLLFSADSIAGLLDTQDTRLQPYDTGQSESQLFHNEDQYPASAAQFVTHEIVFVDAGVDDYQAFLDDLKTQQDGGRRLDVYVLDSERDGIEQITDILGGQQDIDAIHIISHGEAGEVRLGTSTLNLDTLASYQDRIAGWGDTLGEDGDLLIYGCNLAATSDGTALVQNLSSLTGADVAASDDLTGSADRGGDWDLEYRLGAIETGLPLSASVASHWAGVLALTPTAETTLTSNANTQILSATSKGSAQATAMDAAGNYVVVWSSQNQDGSGWGVYAQRFDAAGVAQGPEILVNQDTTGGDQQYASVAMDGSGRFVVVWQGNGGGDADGIFYQRFDNNGNYVGTETRVNTTTGGVQSAADINMDRSNGDFIITWSGNGAGDADGVFFRRFHFDGTLFDNAEILAHTATSDPANPEIDPVVAWLTGGKFVIGWEVDGSDHIYFQRFNSDSSTLGSKKQIDSNFSTSGGLSVDSNASGDFVFVYSQEGAGQAVYARGYHEDGSNLFSNGNLLSVWENVASGGTNPSVAIGDDGRVVVAYQTATTGGDINVAVLDPTGSTVNKSTVHNYTSGDQNLPSLSMLDADNFVVAWSGESSGDTSGVSTRQFNQPFRITVDTVNDVLDGDADVSTIANLQLNPGADGFISLREAITAANNTGNSIDEIYFDIAGAGPHIISLSSALPSITDAVIIDGTSEPDFAGTPVVELDGTNAGAGIDGLSVTAGRSSILGLAIKGFSGNGINLSGGDRNIIGNIAGGANVITGNGGNGIAVNSSSNRNQIRGNAIFANGGIALDLNEDAVTPNDPDDSDSGANNLQNYPVLTAAISSGTDIDISANLTSAAATTFTIDFYASSTADASTYGEAERYIGSTVVTTDSAGFVSFNPQLSGANVSAGEYITATATDAAGNTSEFAQNVQASGSANSNPVADASAGAPYTINEGDAVTLDARNSSDPDGDTLTYQWDLDNDGSYGDVSGANPSVGWAILKGFGINDNGSYTIGLQVDDGNGGISTTTTTLTVNNVAPTLSISGAGSTVAGASYTLNFSASDPGNDTLTSWVINWGDGAIDTLAGNATSATHTYSNAGMTNNILVSATDEDNTGFYIHNDLFAGHYANSAGVYRLPGDLNNTVTQFATGGALDKAIQPVIGPDGYLYVSGESSANVVRYDVATGLPVDAMPFISSGTGSAKLNVAGGFAFGPNGNLFVADFGDDTVKEYSAADGSFVRDFVTKGSGGLTKPYSLAFGSGGDLYVGSYDQGVVYRFDGQTGSPVGSGIFATIPPAGNSSIIEQITFGPGGDLYVNDYANNTVLRFDGATGAFKSTLVSGAANGLDKASGLVFGPDGKLYISSENSGEILRYTATGGFDGQYAAGLDKPSLLAFAPDIQVAVSAANAPPQFLASGPYTTDENTVAGSQVGDIDANDGDGGPTDSGLTYSIVTNTDPDGDGQNAFSIDALTGVISVNDSDDLNFEVNASLGITVQADDGVNQVTRNVTINLNDVDESPKVAVASDASGNYVIVSEVDDVAGNGWDILAQRYDAGGVAVGGPIRINTTGVLNDQFDPAVAMDAIGNFVVVWSGQGQDGDAATQSNIYYSLYDNTGAPVQGATELLANQTTVGDQQYASVAYDGNGDFIITWSSQGQDDATDPTGWGVYARRFNADGSAKSAEFQVNTTTANDQMYSDVSADDYGDFVIAWQSFGQDGSGWGVYSQLYRDSGQKTGGEQLRNQTTAGDQYAVAVAMQGDGDYSLVWVSDGQDGDQGGIYSDSVAWGGSGNNNYGELLVNNTTNGDQNNPDIASDPLGNFVVTWTSTGQDGDAANETNVYGRYVQVTNSTVSLVSSEFRVNSFQPGNQANPAVTADPNGNVVIAWSGNDGVDVDAVSHTLFQNVLNNQTPSVQLANPALSYTEGGPAVAIDSGLTLADPDSSDLTQALVFFRDGFVTGEDILNFTDQLGIQGNYDPGTGVLTLTATAGSAPLGDFQTALRSVTYDNSSTNPDTRQRIIEVEVNDGVSSSSDTRKLNVTAVANNNPPDGADRTITLAEDTPYTFSTGDFGFSDPIDGNSLLAVRLSSLPGAGALTLSGSAVSAGQLIAVADITAGNLVYTPANNGNGVAYASFTFQVQDDGGTASGGLDLDPTPNTLTLDVTAVNDLPVAVDDAAVTGLNTPVVIDVAGNDADIESDPIVVLDVSNPANGTVVNHLDGTVTYTPNAGFTGNDSFSYRMTDSADGTTHYWGLGGDASDSVGASHGTINGATTVAGSFGDALQFDEVSDYVQIPDFTYSNSFTLSFSFKVDDNTGSSFMYLYSHGSVLAQNSLNIYIGESGEASYPGIMKTVLVDSNDTGGLNDLNFDASALIGDGQWHTYTLTVDKTDGARVFIDGNLQASAMRGGDALNPATDLYLGTREDLNVNRYFGGGLDSVQMFNRELTSSEVSEHYLSTAGIGQVTLTVNGQAPTASNLNQSLAYTEGDPSVALNDIVVSDPDSGDLITATLTLADPAYGALTVSGGAIYDSGTGVWTLTDSVANVNTALANVSFIPAVDNDLNTTITTHIEDAAATGPADGVISLNVTPVNDAPSSSDNTVVTLEDTPYPFSVADFGFTDPVEGHNLLAVWITTLPGAGALTLNGLSVSAGQLIAVADIVSGNLVFTPATNASGTGYAGFTFQVQDDGGTANGGIDLDPAPNTMTIDVTADNDTPTTGGITDVVVNEDAVPTVIDLFAAFADVEDPDTALTYTITGNTNASLFTATPLDGVAGTLTLDYAPDRNGFADLTVRATDSGGLFVETTFRVTVNPVNDTPTTAGIADVVVNEDAADTLIDLFAAFADVEDADPALGYSLVSNTNPGLFSATAIDAAAGTLRLGYAANQNGSADLTVRATDTGGAFVETTFTVTVNAVNDAPTGVSLSNTRLQGDTDSSGGLDVGSLSAVDVDTGDTATYSIVGGADAAKFSLGGTGNRLLTIDDGLLSSGQQASYEVIVRVTDSGGLTHDETLTIVVVDVDEILLQAESGHTDSSQSLEAVVNESSAGSGAAPAEAVGASTDELSLDVPETVLGGGQATPPQATGDEAAPQMPQEQAGEKVNTPDVPVVVATPLEKFTNTLLDKIEGPKLNTNFEAVRLVMKAFNNSAGAAEFAERLDQIRDETKDSEILQQKIVGSSMMLSTGLSVGYIVWLVRGGVLISSVLSSLPAWRFIDPLPILATLNGRGGRADEDPESLESMIREGGRKARARQAADARSAADEAIESEKESV